MKSLKLFFIFCDSVLRGVGQVMLQNNPFTGILFIMGIFYNSMTFGISVCLGAVISTLTALLLNFDSAKIKDGIYGFNGALVALGLTIFLEPSFVSWGYIFCATVFSTFLMNGLTKILKKLNLPALTAPFVLTTLVFLLASSYELPKTTIGEGVASSSTVLLGLLQGIGQIFFQENPVTGFIFILGILINSRKSCLMAIVGSLAGLGVAWFLGVSEPSMRSGAFGFNPALTAIALGSLHYTFTNVLLASITTALVSSGVSVALGFLGVPALTLPFVIVTWVFILSIKMNDKGI